VPAQATESLVNIEGANLRQIRAPSAFVSDFDRCSEAYAPCEESAYSCLIARSMNAICYARDRKQSQPVIVVGDSNRAKASQSAARRSGKRNTFLKEFC
jgi:hypothetical protein